MSVCCNQPSYGTRPSLLHQSQAGAKEDYRIEPPKMADAQYEKEVLGEKTDMYHSDVLANNDLMNEAFEGENEEHNEGLWVSAKRHPMACMWAFIMCFTIVSFHIPSFFYHYFPSYIASDEHFRHWARRRKIRRWSFHTTPSLFVYYSPLSPSSPAKPTSLAHEPSAVWRK